MSQYVLKVCSKYSMLNSKPMELTFDNKAAMYIGTNQILQERIKHKEVVYHFIHEKIAENTIKTIHVAFKNNLLI